MRQYGGVTSAPRSTGNLHKYIIMEFPDDVGITSICMYERVCACVIKFACLAEKSFYASKTRKWKEERMEVSGPCQSPILMSWGWKVLARITPLSGSLNLLVIRDSWRIEIHKGNLDNFHKLNYVYLSFSWKMP